MEPAFYRRIDEMEAPTNIHQYVEDHRSDQITVEAPDDLDPVADNLPDPDEQEHCEEDHHHTDEEDEEDGDDDNDEEAEKLWNDYVKVQEILDNKLKSKLNDKSFQKCFKKYINNMSRVARSQEESMKISLYNFGQNLGRCKNSKVMPVRAGTQARRVHPHGGQGRAPSGRRPANCPPRVQMELVEPDQECVYHTLPPHRTPAARRPHSLQLAVDNNEPSSRKH